MGEDEVSGHSKAEPAVLSEAELEKIGVRKQVPPTSICAKTQKIRCSASTAKSLLFRFIPILTWLPRYPVKEWLLGDIISGFSVGIMHLPQGLAYSLLAGLPPVFGLYSAFYPVLVYFFFGTSRHISVGPFAVISVMIGSITDSLEPSAKFMEMEAVNGTNVTILNEARRDAARVQLASALTLLVGIFQIALGLLQFGFLATYLSEPLVRGYTVAAAVQVLISQLKYVFGVELEEYAGPLAMIYAFLEICSKLPKTNVGTLVTSLIAIVSILIVKKISDKLGKRIPVPIPTELLTIIIATGISYGAELNRHFKISVVGEIPSGLVPPKAPVASYFGQVIGNAFAIAVVSYVICVSLGKIFAFKHGYKVDSNQRSILTIFRPGSPIFQWHTDIFLVVLIHLVFMARILGWVAITFLRDRIWSELSAMTFPSWVSLHSFAHGIIEVLKLQHHDKELIALGLSNFVGGFFQCFSIGCSMSRSLVQESTGGHSQVSAAVSCLLLLVTILKISELFRDLPKAILAAIILVNLKGMFKQFKDIRILWKSNFVDLLIWLVTFVATILLNLDMGLGVAVVFSLLTVIFRTQMPNYSILGQVPQTGIYKDVDEFEKAEEIPGVKIFRSSATIYFANAALYEEALKKKCGIDVNHLIEKKKKALKKKHNRDKKEEKKAKKMASKIEKTHDPSITNLAFVDIDMEAKSQEPRGDTTVNGPNGSMDDQRSQNLKQPQSSDQPGLTALGLEKPPFHSIILDFSPVNFVDTVSIKTLKNIFKDFQEIEVNVFVVGCSASVISQLEKGNFFSQNITKHHLFASLHHAVTYITRNQEEELPPTDKVKPSTKL